MRPEKYKRILVIATRQIGDTLITTPLIHRIREIWPDAKIDFLGFKNALPMLQGNPDIHEAIGSSPKPKFKEYLSLFGRIFRKYDLAIITQPSDRAYIYGLFASKNRVGVIHKNEKGNAWKKLITQHQVEIDYFNQHVVTEKLSLLEPFVHKNTNKPQTVSSEISVFAPASDDLPMDLDEISHECVVIHPCPLTKYKRWPIHYWVEVIEFLGNRNIPIFISGGPSEADQLLTTAILTATSEKTRSLIIDGTGRLNFAQLSHFLKNAKAFVGVDTSVTHLAAACNTPTITMFGATPPTNFGPWPNGFSGEQPYQLRARSQTVRNITILQGPGECVPCRKAGCEDRSDSKSECLEQLPASQVIERLKTILNLD
jgi:heptosyltransferase-3